MPQTKYDLSRTVNHLRLNVYTFETFLYTRALVTIGIDELAQACGKGDHFVHQVDTYVNRDETILENFLNMFKNQEDVILFVSGEFGKNFIEVCNKENYDDIKCGIIWLKGSVLTGDNISMYVFSYDMNKHRRAIMLDGTFYSGNTYFYLKGWIKGSMNVDLNHLLVAYDGSKDTHDYVHSCYRYFDHYNDSGEAL